MKKFKMCLCWMLLMIAPSLLAQNYSGLQNKTLMEVRNAETLSTQLFPEIYGIIYRVFVRHDTEIQLNVVMQYGGYENTYIQAEVLDHNFSPQRQIPLVTGQLTGKSQAVELKFSLKDNLPRGTTIRSKYLRITITEHPDYKSPRNPSSIYKLNKAWKVVGNGDLAINRSKNREYTSQDVIRRENSVAGSSLVRVTLKPIGSAIALVNGKMSIPAKSIVNKNAGLGSASSGLYSVDSMLFDDPIGPGKFKFSLWENLKADLDFEFDEISPISLEIYQDANLKSRQFYYLPNSFNLQWNDNTGYQLKNLYGSAASKGEAGNVKIHAGLSSGINSLELAFVKKLLDIYAKRNFGFEDTKLKVLPIGATPIVSFGHELSSLYNISADKISVNVSSDIAQPLNVSWLTDGKIRDEIVVALIEGVGINGSAVITPLGDSLGRVEIPVSINIKDPKTFGPIGLNLHKWRNEYWKNPTPYPIQLNYLHVLMTNQENDGKIVPFIYSWDLGSAKIISQSRVFFDASEMPKWIDSAPNTLRAWLDFEILPCDRCDQAAINATLGGTSKTLTQKITFELFDVMEKTGAKLINIAIRSTQLDPKENNNRQSIASLRVQEDGIYTGGPLFITNDNQPDFEYRLSIIMPDGTKYQAQNWVHSDQLEVYLGMKHLKEAFPMLLSQN